ncbi:MAG: hypothetical protein MK441_03460, partial [SAR324 cluster bacterium]|nr:hypothetical protein [SAR324 cluster bacterium]
EATDEQIEFPLVYAIGKEGIAQLELKEKGKDLVPLMEMIVEHLPAPEFKQDADFWNYVFPSWEGIEIFRRAFYSYAGTFSYLVRGRISVSDLFHSDPSYLAAPSSWLGRD